LSQSVTASIVLYKQSVKEVGRLFEELGNASAFSEWVVIDNGGSGEACAFATSLGARCLCPGRNLGFGAGHNLALRSLNSKAAPYHLILNPDIAMERGTVTELVAVMEASPQVGLLMPQVLYPDGSTQHLCKLLPTPLDLLLRRFTGGPLRWLFGDRMALYDLRNVDLSSPMYVPVLSGCFMLARRAILESIGGFDERFFLYMEDVDLCRRMGDVTQLLFYPAVSVQHGHEQGSYKHLHLLQLHVRAAIAYFNKWGWFRDPVRRARNSAGLQKAAVPHCSVMG
jgi:GT2 family glycosyltransferase